MSLGLLRSLLQGLLQPPGLPGLPDTGVLPGELAGPLQFPNAAITRWPLLALLLAAALWMLYRWRRRRQTRDPEPATATVRRTPAPPGQRGKGPTLGDLLRGLRDRFLASHQYRQGCHELTALLKRHFETSGVRGRRLPWTRMTAREIRSTTGEKAASQLLVQLSVLRFGRADPTRRAFERACHRAEQVVGAHLRKSVRPATVSGDDFPREGSTDA
jgi:hypothetical protein